MKKGTKHEYNKTKEKGHLKIRQYKLSNCRTKTKDIYDVMVGGKKLNALTLKNLKCCPHKHKSIPWKPWKKETRARKSYTRFKKIS